MAVHSKHPLRPVVLWLLSGCVLIACMVVIGGVTRLTQSGLSITEWKPISGAVPPLDEAQWQAEFEAYKRIPEYTLKNGDMDLAGFKEIYFWEYLHRNWGRLMGMAFIVPFTVFWRKGLLKGWLMKRSIVILIGGGLVGALGWFMVKSGLTENPDVSHYRLAIHLCAAFTVFSMVLWTLFDIRSGIRSFVPDDQSGSQLVRVILVLLFLQIVWGAFTAGLDAGSIYSTWPLMNGELMPANVMAYESPRVNFMEHRDGVQFVHRNLAWLVALGVVGLILRHGQRPGILPIRWWLLSAVLFQFGLGVLTVLTQVDLIVAVLHQFGALLLLAVLIKALHSTGRPRSLV